MKKISLAGAQEVGKTSLCSQLTDKNPDLEYFPTIGVECSIIDNWKETGKKVCFYDFSGKKEHFPLISNYILLSDIMILVYDTHLVSSVVYIENIYTNNIKSGERGIQVVVVGTKMDINGGRNCILDADSFCLKNGLIHITVNSKTKEGIEGLVQALKDRLKQQELDIEIDKSYRECDWCIMC